MIRSTYKTVRAGIVPVESIETTCPKCHQSLPHDHVEQVKLQTVAENLEIEKKLAEIEEQGKNLAAQIQQLQQAESTEPDHITKMRDWIKRFDEGVEHERNEKAQYDANLKTFNEAKATLAKRDGWLKKQDEIIAELEEKLAAIKEFRFNFVKIQQHKLDSLFDKVRIVLSKADKETGEIKEEFKITWGGRAYQTLSTSERVRCDIEIGKALSSLRMNPEPMPVFVDNAEGVQDLFGENFAGQVIAAYVFQSQLMVKSYDDTMNDIEAELRQFQALTRKKGA